MSIQKEVNKIQPFEISEDRYQYFDLGRIMKDIEFSERQYQEAQSLVSNQKVVLHEVEIGYRHLMKGSVLSGIAHGSFDDGRYQRQVSIVFDREGIIQGSCSVPGCGGYYQTSYYYSTKSICKHMLALLLLLDEYLKKYNPGDSTDGTGLSLFHKFRNQHVKEVIEKNTEQVHDLMLEPVLEREGEDLFLTFKAGTGKNN